MPVISTGDATYRQPFYEPPHYTPPGSPIAPGHPGNILGPLAGPQAGASPFFSDPGYLAALAQEQAGVQAADAALRAAREQAIVGFGDPALAAALGLDVSPQTAQAAAANPNSTVKRFQEQRDQNRQGIINSLAAHGVLFSGDLGYQTGENEKRYGRSVYDAGQELLAGLYSKTVDAAHQKQTLKSQTLDALMGAYDRFAGNPNMYGAATAPLTGAPSPLTSALAGKPKIQKPPTTPSLLAGRSPLANRRMTASVR